MTYANQKDYVVSGPWAPRVRPEIILMLERVITRLSYVIDEYSASGLPTEAVSANLNQAALTLHSIRKDLKL